MRSATASIPRKPTVHRLWDAHVHVAAEHTAGDHERHAPERHRDDAAELEGGVEENQPGPERAQEDVHLQPLPERAEAGEEREALSGGVAHHAHQDHPRAHDAEALPHQARGREPGGHGRERALAQGKEVVGEPPQEGPAGYGQPDHDEDESQHGAHPGWHARTVRPPHTKKARYRSWHRARQRARSRCLLAAGLSAVRRTPGFAPRRYRRFALSRMKTDYNLTKLFGKRAGRAPSPTPREPLARRGGRGECSRYPSIQEASMPRYLIERNIPGAGNLSPEELQAISQKSCSVLSDLGPQIQWVQSYVSGDKITCIYIAPRRGDGAGARPPGRLPGRRRAGGQDHHRPDDGGGERQGVASGVPATPATRRGSSRTSRSAR